MLEYKNTEKGCFFFFQGEARTARAVFRVKTAKIKKKGMFFLRLIKIRENGMFFTYCKHGIRV